MRMVAILCPHCQGEIELDADASGKFECPHCGREFEWNIKDGDSTIANPGSGKVAPPYAWLFSKVGLVAIPVPLILAFVLLPFSLLAGLVMIFLSANLFIAGSSLGSWFLEELTKFDFSDGIEMFWGSIFAVIIISVNLVVFLIAILFGLFGLAIIYSAIVSLKRR
ncbi:MAG: hypothetical protein CMB19_05030 [Euryarchaeota archaeon]|nr:hypothetical protein [Euryarchaeota archaeon]